MCDVMMFPDTAEEFMEQYKIVDTEKVYTNGAELIPIFRMKQWLEHLQDIESEPQWIPCSERLPEDKTAYYLATIANHGLFFTTTLNNNVECVRWDYDRRKGQDSWHWCTERTVIAWMPLPEPYREEGEK